MDAEKSVRQKWRLLKATMDERARRLWAGTEAGALGHGGVAAVARATGWRSARFARDGTKRAKARGLKSELRKLVSGGSSSAAPKQHVAGLIKLAQAIPPRLREIHVRSQAPFSAEAMQQLQRAVPDGATIR